MPSSAMNQIQHNLDILLDVAEKKIENKSILDVGCGWGKYGLLLREYLECDFHHGTFLKKDWKYKIHCVEGFPEYINDVHHHVYDEFFINTIQRVHEKLGNYGLIFSIDMFEHLDLEDAKICIDALLNKCEYLFLSLPYDFPQEDVFNNELERHRLNGPDQDQFWDHVKSKWTIERDYTKKKSIHRKYLIKGALAK